MGVGDAVPAEPWRVLRDRGVLDLRRTRISRPRRRPLAALIEVAEARGLWKLVSRVFPENEASLSLCRSLGFREVGVYRRHGRLDGSWRDVVIVERLLGAAARES